MTDDELARLLREAITVAAAEEPLADLWPLLVKRIRPRPTWSWIDLTLTVAVAVAPLIIPEWFWLVAYYF